MMEKALPELETGSDGYKSVLESLTKLTKAFPATAAVPGIQKSALAGLAQRANSDSMMRQALQAKAAGAGSAPGGPPGGAPPPSPQGAPAGAM